MANPNIPVRFTEEKYATKSEVSKELNIHFIDSIWSNILAYRANFNRYLNLRTIENTRITFCSCPTISEKVNEAERKLTNLLGQYSKLTNNNDHNYLRGYYYVEALKNVAKIYDLDVTNEYLRTIVTGELKEINGQYIVLANYAESLKYIENAYVNPISEDFLGDFYTKLLGSGELTSFYRTTEDKHPENRVIIDRIYTAAPVSSIQILMNTLFDFIHGTSVSTLVKSIITYYYVNYVKPFPKHNDEVAILLAKAVLAHELGAFGVLINLEVLLSTNLEKIAKIFLEVQKTGDVTYFVNYAISVVMQLCDQMGDHIVNLNATGLKQDFFKEDSVVEEAVVEETLTSEELNKTIEETTEETVVEEVKDVSKTKKIKIIAKEEEIAVSYIPTAIDEKEAYRLEQHLLELDPSLKKGEAKFYARHCTLGKKYTIAQYKKAIGCVYETARTAMDHLAELGYYRKEQLKNKYVYSPIPRK